MIETKTIRLKDGTEVNAASPLIVSASRATDIPAFYSDWLIHAFKRGYVLRENPFNRRKYFISLENCGFIVFWSKNYIPMKKNLSYFTDKKIPFYLQYTLNDYENENFEPGIPSLDRRTHEFNRLADIFGKDRIIWRFDPLILTEKTGTALLAERIFRIHEKISKSASTLTISFADIKNYPSVRKNMNAASTGWLDWDAEKINEFCGRLRTGFGNSALKINSCSESFDLNEFGISHASCIDGDRIIRIAGKDLVSGITNDAFFRKDPGQRKYCGCIISRDIGSYDTCPNGCIYCYANSSEEAVLKKRAIYDAESEGLCL